MDSEPVYGTGDEPQKEPAAVATPVPVKIEPEVILNADLGEGVKVKDILTKVQQQATELQQLKSRLPEPAAPKVDPNEALDQQFYSTPSQASQQVAMNTMAPFIAQQNRSMADQNMEVIVNRHEDEEVKSRFKSYVEEAKKILVQQGYTAQNAQTAVDYYLSQPAVVKNYLQQFETIVAADRYKQMQAKANEEYAVSDDKFSPSAFTPSAKTTTQSAPQRIVLSDQEKEYCKQTGMDPREYYELQNVRGSLTGGIDVEDILEADKKLKGGKK